MESKRWEILLHRLIIAIGKFISRSSYLFLTHSRLALFEFRQKKRLGIAATGATDVCRKLTSTEHRTHAAHEWMKRMFRVRIVISSIVPCRLWLRRRCVLWFTLARTERESGKTAYTHQPRLQTVYVDTGSTQSDVIRSKKPTRHLRDLRCVTPHTHDMLF